MDSTVILVLQEFKKALSTLDEALQADPKDVFVRDASVKRFEYSFELCWKTAKAHLSENNSICGTTTQSSEYYL